MAAYIPSPVARARCAGIPALAAFAEAMRPDDPPAEFDRCRAPFAALMASPFLDELAAWELRCLRADPDYVPSGGGDLLLEALRMGPLNLSVRLMMATGQAPPSQLKGFCEHALMATAGAGRLILERWRQNSTGPAEVLDRAALLEPQPTVELEPGSHVSFTAHRDVARSHAVQAPVVTVTLTRNLVTRLRWVYDAKTLAPVAAEAAESSTSRLEYAAALLASLEHQGAAPAIAGLYDHPDHFVRWSAVQHTMRLDPELGGQLVRRATEDPHPHVRRAAVASLARMGG